METVLITGSAGFIGAALATRFLEFDFKVVGIDNINSYYDKDLKLNRLKNIEKNLSKGNNWIFKKASITDKETIRNIFFTHRPRIVVNLAAQAGVRYSLENPQAYVESNLVGFANILEICKEFEISHLIYASSSSVYGGNKNLPFDEEQKVSNPISLYAATKLSNELMANSYSHIYKIPTTGLRFFTVYGPWGRPDMAPMIFAKSIFENRPINIFNYGKMQRDFTFIDDIVEGIFRCCLKRPHLASSFSNSPIVDQSSSPPHQIFNIGNSKPVELLKFIDLLEENIGMKAIKNFTEIQSGDVINTSANTEKLKSWIDYSPSTPIDKGIKLFVKWYKNYYKF